MHTETMKRLVRKNKDLMSALRLIRDLGLPEGYVSAGMIRNYVWDVKHGYVKSTPLNDVDVIYFDSFDVTEETEKAYENRLKDADSTLPWSVKNQARMHMGKRDEPYQSVEDAMKHWPETATAVAVRLEEDDTLSVIAPFGLEDLFSLTLRKSPYLKNRSLFERRLRDKGWLNKWPRLRVVNKEES